MPLAGKRDEGTGRALQGSERLIPGHRRKQRIGADRIEPNPEAGVSRVPWQNLRGVLPVGRHGDQVDKHRRQPGNRPPRLVT